MLYGGRDSSKTWDAAGIAIQFASTYKVRFLCTRQFQNRIEESVYTILKSTIHRFGLQDEFDIQKARITHKYTGSEFIFMGLWRNIDEIKSMEGIDICWIEEAHNLTAEQWKILNPTIRKEGSMIWVVFNPKLVTDFTYQRFVVKPPKNTVVCKINYTHNPFLSDTSRNIINEAYKEDEKEATHVYGGEPKLDDTDSIIKRSWLMACIDAHKKLNVENVGGDVIGYDVADSGDDLNSFIHRKGFLALHLEEWQGEEHELFESTTRVHKYAKRVKAHINYDSIGVGAGVGSNIKTIDKAEYDIRHHVKFTPFNAGSKVINPDDEYEKDKLNKDMFANLKAQAWWSVADRLKATFKAVTQGTPIDTDKIIAIDSNLPNLERLITELCTPRKSEDNLYRQMVESKKALKKRGIASPNNADAFIMAYFKASSRNMLLEAMNN